MDDILELCMFYHSLLSFLTILWYVVNALIKAAEQKSTFTPKKGSKDMGTIHIDQCKITGADKPAAMESAAASGGGNSLPMPVPVPVPVEQMANMSLGAGQKPTFVDYVTGNCDLGLVRLANVVFLQEMHTSNHDSDNYFSRLSSALLLISLEATATLANLAHCITSAVTA